MLICEECFADPELRAAVSANSTSSGECDICHTYGKLLDLSEFTDFFDALLFLFEPVSNFSKMSRQHMESWMIF